MNALSSPLVAVVRLGSRGYPQAPPFPPPTPPPEYAFDDSRGGLAPNPVYEAVRDLWRLLGWDAARYGTRDWNPLGHLVRPGDSVLVKPNLISETNWDRPGAWQEVVTHPSVVRAVVDYILIALGGKGAVRIADGPQTDSDFETLKDRTGLAALVGFYRSVGCPVELVDLRRERWLSKGGVTRRRLSLPGDPAGYASVDLSGESAFASYRLSGRFYGADYDVEETRAFHDGGRHEYVLCRSALEADVIVNIPKLKTHKKTGVTISLKNLVGVNGHRNCLPHHTIGTPSEGGDEFPESGVRRAIESRGIARFKRHLAARGGSGGVGAALIKRLGRGLFGDTSRVVRSGNWHGNDTAWRMVLDLNRAVLWYDPAGRPRGEPRRYLTVVDGVIGGEGNGPLAPAPVDSGLLLAGTNPWAVDTAAVREMGLDPQRIPLLAAARRESMAWLLPDGDVSLVESGPRRSGWRPFVPHFGWSPLAAAETGPIR